MVSGDWSEEMARFYRYLDEIGDLGLDLNEVRRTRPEIAGLLRDHAAKGK